MAKSTKTFKQYFSENITTSVAGIRSTDVTGEDKQGDHIYAPNDSRIVKPLGKVETRTSHIKKKSKNTKNCNKPPNIKIPCTNQF